jgi:hypothetical protein
MRSGWSIAAEPTTKNVAWTWCLARTSRICGVHTGSGPSSNVSASVPSAGPAVCTAPPRASITGPPCETAVGTVADAASAPVDCSA